MQSVRKAGMEIDMSKMMSKIKCMYIIIGAAVIMGAAGCASQKDSAGLEQRKVIIDDYAKIILLQDKDSANYDKALEAAGTYIEDPSQAQKIAALQTIQDITEQMDADSKECKPIEISDGLGQMLEDNQIMLMYGKGASNRKQAIDRQHHTIPSKINMKESLCRGKIARAFSI